MPSPSLNVRQSRKIVETSSEEKHQIMLDAIAELEEMYKRGDIETPAYFIKKRALIKLL